MRGVPLWWWGCERAREGRKEAGARGERTEGRGREGGGIGGGGGARKREEGRRCKLHTRTHAPPSRCQLFFVFQYILEPMPRSGEPREMKGEEDDSNINDILMYRRGEGKDIITLFT